MKRYFCYSSALDTHAFEEWAAQHGHSGFRFPKGTKAVAQGWELCFDFPSRYWGGLVLGLQTTTNTNDFAEGVVFEIEDNKWGMVQHKEGVVTGASEEITIDVKVGSEILKAQAFKTHPTRTQTSGAKSETFIETLKRSYQKWGLHENLRKIS